MNVLVVEDSGAVAYPLVEALEEIGYTVFLAPNITRANYYWEKKDVSCIIVDLNMDPEGLAPSEIGETRGGLLTGWIWLRNHVLIGNENVKKRIIILTAYMKDLKEIVGQKELEGIDLLEKSPPSVPPIESVLGSIRRIALCLDTDSRETRDLCC